MIGSWTWRAGAAVLALVASAAATAQSGDTARIIDEGMNRSRVMVTASELVDGIGARLSNSTSMRRAEDWELAEMNGLGLANVRREGFEFGRGWDMIDSEVRMVSPRPLKLTAIPVAWTPGTNGALRAPVVIAPISKRRHFDAYRGKLAGKIVLISLPGEGSEPTESMFTPARQRFARQARRWPAQSLFQHGQWLGQIARFPCRG